MQTEARAIFFFWSFPFPFYINCKNYNYKLQFGECLCHGTAAHGDQQEHQMHVMIDGEIMPSDSVNASIWALPKLSVDVLCSSNHCTPTTGLGPLVMASTRCCLASHEPILCPWVFLPHPTGSLPPSVSYLVWLCLLMSIVLELCLSTRKATFT